MSNSGKHNLAEAIEKINLNSTDEARLLFEKGHQVSKAGVFVRSYLAFFRGIFSKNEKSAPLYFRGMERMLRTMLTNLKLLKLQKKI
ncbi:MAG: hypothetical protein K8I03_09945 [Ignavibacteria bacterium]|nr:hypothetical protein [Ignavibacteria bacterium]